MKVFYDNDCAKVSLPESNEVEQYMLAIKTKNLSPDDVLVALDGLKPHFEKANSTNFQVGCIKCEPMTTS